MEQAGFFDDDVTSCMLNLTRDELGRIGVTITKGVGYGRERTWTSEYYDQLSCEEALDVIAVAATTLAWSR